MHLPNRPVRSYWYWCVYMDEAGRWWRVYAPAFAARARWAASSRSRFASQAVSRAPLSARKGLSPKYARDHQSLQGKPFRYLFALSLCIDSGSDRRLDAPVVYF